jgi:hypothetical protein
VYDFTTWEIAGHLWLRWGIPPPRGGPLEED